MRGYAQVTCKCYTILYKALVSAGFLEPVPHGQLDNSISVYAKSNKEVEKSTLLA